MLKYFCTFVGCAGMIGDALLPLLAQADHLGWMRWRVPIVACAVLALIAFATQAYLQYHEDRDGRQQQEERDKRFEELTIALVRLGDASKSSAQQEVTTTFTPLEGRLRGKVIQLAHDLFAFLREKGPEPNPQPDASLGFEDRLREIMRATGPYIENVFYGYNHRFKQRVIDMFNELAEHGIRVPEVQEGDINPPHGQNSERIRKIAESLYLVAARMDAAEATKGA